MAFGRKRPPPGRGQRKTTQPLTQPPVTVAKAILQSPRRSHKRLGDPQLLRRLWEKRAFCSRPANRRGANTLQLASLCGKTAACQRSRFIRSPAQNGFARLLQKAAEARNKARAGSAEGRKNARKEAQDGAASRRSKEYGALCALLFARLLYDSLRLCRAAKPRHRFSAPPRASRAARRPARARPDSLCRRTGGKGCAISSNGNAPVYSGFQFRR